MTMEWGARSRGTGERGSGWNSADCDYGMLASVSAHGGRLPTLQLILSGSVSEEGAVFHPVVRVSPSKFPPLGWALLMICSPNTKAPLFMKTVLSCKLLGEDQVYPSLPGLGLHLPHSHTSLSVFLSFPHPKLLPLGK